MIEILLWILSMFMFNEKTILLTTETEIGENFVLTTDNALNYRQDIYHLLASGKKLQEVKDLPDFQGMRRLSRERYEGNELSLPSYQIGEYYLFLCGIGGGAFSPVGNACEIAGGAYSFPS
ncbi:MAG: hypothetical protein LBI53_03070 [Candidatus Peribacteria bacterium]|nr:hypothetical protein [Candidatus Peribacteria bacterium]